MVTQAVTNLLGLQGLQATTRQGGGGRASAPPARKLNVIGWACNRKQCEAACKGRLNNAGRTECFLCGVPKAQAMSPPTADRLKPTKAVVPPPDAAAEEEPGWSTAKSKREKRRAAKAAGAGGQGGSLSGQQPLVAAKPDERLALAASTSSESGSFARNLAVATAAKAADHPSHLAFPPDILSLASLILPSLGPVLSGLAAERVPNAAATKETAEEAVIRLVLQNSPGVVIAEKEKLEKQVQSSTNALASLDPADNPDVYALVKDRLDAQQLALDKALKKAPSPEREKLALIQTKAAFEQSVQGRYDQHLAGCGKAETRHAAWGEHLAEVAQQLVIVQHALEQLVQENVAAHTKHHEAVKEHDRTIVRLLEAKIAAIGAPAAVPSAATAPASTGGAADVASAATPPTATALNPLLREVQSDRDRTVAAMAAMELEVTRLRTELAQAQAVPMEIIGFETTADDLKLENLPSLDMPDKQVKLAAFGRVYGLLNVWASLGATVPFTWEDLHTNLQGDIDPVAVAQEILGGSWALWFGSEQVLATSVVPRQLGIVVRDRLDTLRQSYEQWEQTKADAARSFAVITEQSKKRRAAA